MPTPRYLDYAASTPLDPRVAEAMAAVASMPGNPSSIHGYGRPLREAVDGARAAVAGLVGVAAGDVIFTSGATEANVTALVGSWRDLVRRDPDRRMTVLASAIEHASVAEPLARIAEREGATVIGIPVGADGVASPADVAAAIRPDTVLVSVMWANNVLGTVQPIAAIGEIVAAERVRRGAGGLPIIFHCDAVQAVTTQPVRPRDVGVDLLTLSAHKMHGPKGVGAIIRGTGVPLEPIIVGGGQEEGMRQGTENVAGIAGFGRAAEILADERDKETARLASLRAAFLEALAVRAPTARVVCGASPSVPGIMFVSLPNIAGDHLAMSLDADGFAVSAGSACDSGKRRRSRVLNAVMDERRAAHGGIRVSFGRFSAQDDLLAFADALGRLSKR